jgi:hypothetical protein
MAVNLNEICRLCLEEIKTPSATLKEGSNLLIKIRRFLPLVKVSLMKVGKLSFLGGWGVVKLSCIYSYVLCSNAITDIAYHKE